METKYVPRYLYLSNTQSDLLEKLFPDQTNVFSMTDNRLDLQMLAGGFSPTPNVSLAKFDYSNSVLGCRTVCHRQPPTE